MASTNEYDNVPMLPVSDTSPSSRTRPFSSTIDVLGYTDPVGTQIRPPLVQMSDPLSSTRSHEPPFPLPPPPIGASSSQPELVSKQAAQIPTPRVYATSDSTLHDPLDDAAKARRFSQFFAFTCLMSVFVDPLFFFPIEIYQKDMCIKIDWRTAKILAAVKTFTDILYYVNILFQKRLAYAALESTVVGAGHPIKFAGRYLRRNFWIDLFIVFPLPQILLVFIIPYQLGTSWANTTKDVLRITVLLQCLPKFYRLFPLIVGQAPKWFIIESALMKFFINLLTFMLAGHVVGSCWYLFALQRVNQCLRDACGKSVDECKQLIDCGRETSNQVLQVWKSNVTALACFREDGFHYGIYWKAVNLTRNSTQWYERYSYSLFWGFQQISTLAGNQVPSYYFWEVLFTMGIIGLGLFLFALLIGNMQNFLQSIGRRDMEMTLRRRDVEQWMSHRRFPKDMRKRVKEVERFNWNDTRGVNEELLCENMPDDLQRDIRRHLFASLKKVRIFWKMDETILDAIRGRLKQRTYLKSSMVLNRGGLVNKMVFIVRGKMESIGEDGSPTPLLEGDVCGEELLTWCQECSSGNPDGARIRKPSKGLFSNRDVKCVTNVEAFSLSVADLDDVMSLFPTLEIHKQL